MPTSIIHLSDLHLRKGWAEEQGVVLDAFFDDLKKQTEELENVHLIFTGDILQSGESLNLYEYFTKIFHDRLLEIGIDNRNLIFLPGNHDVDRNYTNTKLSILKPLQDTITTERHFNDNIYTQQKDLIYKKFEPFIKWQETVSAFSFSENDFCGKGFEISKYIGIYCLNTALFSFGDLKDKDGKVIKDERALPVETRRLHEWIQSTKFKYRILAMHHPKTWLIDWAKSELERIENTEFDLVLCGHIHENSAFHKSDGKNSVIECVSPPLFTAKSGTLGYSILHINENIGVTQIQYRQWTGKTFVTGSYLSNTDNGIVKFSNYLADKHENKQQFFEAVQHFLKNSFDETLKCYTSLPAIWVMPDIASHAECSTENENAVIQSADHFCTSLQDCIIKALPQFGLSSLGRFIAWKTWVEKPGHYVLYLDSSKLQNHESAIKKTIKNSLLERGLEENNLYAIILDESQQLGDRKINNIKKLYPETPLIILNRIEYNNQINEPLALDLEHEFSELYLWALNRGQIRQIVKQFIDAGHSLDENSAIQRLTDDLENLNLHRSPLNCITLLTIYEKQIDYSPANRTEMLERFLFVLFSAYKKHPDYSSYPDMKDSFYVLGQYCEKLFREKKYEFSKADFIATASKYCTDMAIDVDVSHLFSVMLAENVIVQKDNKNYFRYVHWIYFFAAHRMHHNTEFRDYVLYNTNYVYSPELIEFYSGIDRRRHELLDLLTKDLRNLNESFEQRSKIERNFDPYSTAKWAPTNLQIREMHEHIQSEMKQSSLPVSVKDQIADHNYDKSRPYDQGIRSFIKDSSLRECTQMMSASARALRNSDYVEKEKKYAMLTEITRAWSKIIQVLAIISPVLAGERRARYENLGFYLDYDWPDTEDKEQLWMDIMRAIPTNVVTYYEKDLSSARMAPLLIEFIENSSDDLGKYIVSSCIMRQKPRGWLDGIKKYMLSLDKNSFYLLSIFLELHREYRYGFCSLEQKKELEELFGVAIAKHDYGSKKPSVKLIKKAAKNVVENIKGRVEK